MQVHWGTEKIITFLELLESERVIWDMKDKNRKYKHKIQSAWKRISANMDNIPIVQLKAKKKSLMATFRPLLKKKINSIRSGAGEDDTFQPIWFAYDVMERFLGTTYEVDETINTEEEYPSDKKPPPSPEPSERQNKLKRAITCNKTGSPNKRINMECIRLDDAEKKISHSLETLSRVLEGKRIEEDECDIYAKLLAKKLRKYPEGMRDRIMYKIDGLLLDNPYPDQANARSLQSPQQYSHDSTPSPDYVIPNSALEVNITEGNEPWQNFNNKHSTTSQSPIKSPELVENSIPKKEIDISPAVIKCAYSDL